MKTALLFGAIGFLTSGASGAAIGVIAAILLLVAVEIVCEVVKRL